MTEERLERVMEQFGDTVEKTVEGAATAFDKSMNYAWKIKKERFLYKSHTYTTGIGHMASYITLEEKGQHKAAKACLIGGGIILAVQTAELLFVRKK